MRTRARCSTVGGNIAFCFRLAFARWAGKAAEMAMRRAAVACWLATSLLLTGCTGVGGQAQSGPTAVTSGPSSPLTTTTAGIPSGQPNRPASTGTSEPIAPGASDPRTQPAGFRQTAAMATVRHLAEDIGPRLATSPAFDRASDWVERRLSGYGYDTSLQTVQVPAGSSWGCPSTPARQRT